MTKEVHYRSDGGMSYHCEWEYDERGNQVKEIEYDVRDSSTIWSYEWEYDSEGYITKENIFYKGQARSVLLDVPYWYEYIYE